MAKKYSKTHMIDNKMMRYNYETCELEWIYDTDFDIDGNGDLTETKLPEPMVLVSIGLSQESWKDEGREYMTEWNDELTEELHHLEAEIY